MKTDLSVKLAGYSIALDKTIYRQLSETDSLNLQQFNLNALSIQVIHQLADKIADACRSKKH